MTRLHEKIAKNRAEINMVETDFIDDANLAVLAYGSVARSARRAVVMARKTGTRVGLVRPITLWPFPELTVERLAERMDAIIVPEMNLGQYVREVERYARGKCRVIPIPLADGTLHTPEMILSQILGA
jgi:2-oxoglutarate/2-oxoacid ferredoxin oxidoreductase subunit alpha